MLNVGKIVRKNLEIWKKAVPLHSVISFSVINYVVSMRGPHGSGDNLFFYVYTPLACRHKSASSCAQEHDAACPE